MFEVGDVVAHVSGKAPPAPKGRVRLVSNKLLDDRNAYRVSKVLDFQGEIGIVLRGHPSEHETGAYLACCFRKIDEGVTEEFRVMLRGLPVEERV